MLQGSSVCFTLSTHTRGMVCRPTTQLEKLFCVLLCFSHTLLLLVLFSLLSPLSQLLFGDMINGLYVTVSLSLSPSHTYKQKQRRTKRKTKKREKRRKGEKRPREEPKKKRRRREEREEERRERERETRSVATKTTGFLFSCPSSSHLTLPLLQPHDRTTPKPNQAKIQKQKQNKSKTPCLPRIVEETIQWIEADEGLSFLFTSHRTHSHFLTLIHNKENLKLEGIFRISGSVLTCRKLMVPPHHTTPHHVSYTFLFPLVCLFVYVVCVCVCPYLSCVCLFVLLCL